MQLCVVAMPGSSCCAPGLVGLPSSGKTTLFQLLTSAREAPRPHGKAEANVGVSRVPDDRLDRLTALFSPKKRVPATVEFADMAAGRGDAKSLLDVVGVPQCRRAAARRPRVSRSRRSPHPQVTIDPLRDVADDRRRADPRRPRRRRAAARAARERSEENAVTRSSSTSRTISDRAARRALEEGRALRTLGLVGDDARRLRGFQFLSAKPLLVVMNLDEADVATPKSTQRGATRPPVGAACLADSRARGAGVVGVCAKIELEIAQLDPADAAAFMADLGLAAVGPRSRHPRGVRSARLHLVLHRRRRRVPRLVDSARTPPRTKPPARFTPTFSAVSSARKSSAATAARARIARGVPRSRRAAPRRQGVPRRRRRRDQLPSCHVIDCRAMPQTILVCEAQVPFVQGGAEYHVRELVRAAAAPRVRRRARQRAVQVVSESAKSSRTPRRGGCSISARATAGRSIWSSRTKFPTYFARHPRKVAWLIHQYRAAYELAGTPFSDFDAHRRRRRAARAADRARHGDARRMPPRVRQRAATPPIARARFNGIARRAAVSPAASGRPAAPRTVSATTCCRSAGWSRSSASISPFARWRTSPATCR